MSSPGAQLQSVFDTFTISLRRWECQGDYAVDSAQLSAWRRGESPDLRRKQAWLNYIRKITAAGKSFSRVRMLTEPATEYLRWLIDQTETNVAAGEDIRWIAARAATELAMPRYDFYVIDDSELAIMHFDADKQLAELEFVTDEANLLRHRNLLAAAWRVATPHAKYLRGQ